MGREMRSSHRGGVMVKGLGARAARARPAHIEDWRRGHTWTAPGSKEKANSEELKAGARAMKQSDGGWAQYPPREC